MPYTTGSCEVFLFQESFFNIKDSHVLFACALSLSQCVCVMCKHLCVTYHKLELVDGMKIHR